MATVPPTSRRHVSCSPCPPRDAARDRLPRRTRATARAAEAMPMLRRPHDHHRDLRAWLPAKASPHTCSADNPDRHLMRPSPPLDNCSDTCHPRRLSAGSARTRVGAPELPALSQRILSCSVQPTRLGLHAPSLSRQKRSRRPLRSNLLKPDPAARFRALALLGHRPPQPVDDVSCRRPRNLHRSRSRYLAASGFHPESGHRRAFGRGRLVLTLHLATR